jgi:PST family polysaccharide transporter
MIDRSALRELWGFSGSLLGFRAVNYWARNADNLLIGRFIGVATLGLYARAYNTMLLPLNQISNITSNVMFSALSGIQDDLERVRRGYLRAVGMIAVVAFPSMIGLMVVADRFVAVAYGNRWHEAVPLLRILCVAGLAQSIGTTTGWIMQSRGRTDWLFRWGLFLSGITLTGFNIGVHWGAIGVTTSYAAANVLCAYPGFVVICRLIELPMRNLARALYKPLFASAVMGGAIYVVGSALPGSWSPAYGLLLLVVLGGAVYLAGLALLGADALRDILALKQGT